MTWQLAGDLLPRRHARAADRHGVQPPAPADQRRRQHRGGVPRRIRRDRVNTFGTAFLGLTLECARCHDHKFDPITQRDYYSLFAFFHNIDESGLYSHFTARRRRRRCCLAVGRRAATRDQRSAARIADDGRQLTALAREGQRRRSSAWLGHARPLSPTGAESLTSTFDTVDCRDDAGSRGRHTGAAHDGPRWSVSRAQRRRGAALQRRQRRRAPGRADVRRAPTRSRSTLWLKPTEAQAARGRAASSRAWTDAGSRGYELTLEDGRAFFGLIHFWPGNAIAVRARRALPLRRWSHAGRDLRRLEPGRGHRLYVDGLPLATEVVRDRLSRTSPTAGPATIRGQPSVDAGGAVPRQRLQGRADRRPAGLRRRAHGRGSRRRGSRRAADDRRGSTISWPASIGRIVDGVDADLRRLRETEPTRSSRTSPRSW